MDEFKDDEFEDNFDPNDYVEDIDDDFDPNDTEEDIEDDFDPNDIEEDIDDDFDPNDTEEDIEDDFDPNDIEEDIEDNFDPNDTEEDIEDDFDPNDYVEDIDDDFDPNDNEEKNEENEFEQIDNGEGIGAEKNNFDKEKGEEEESEECYHENISSEPTCTVLVSENKEEIQEADQDELEREIEKELEEGVEGINKYLEEEAEFINAYQEMVRKERELDQERELEGEVCQKTDEEWEKEVETAAYTAEQLYESTKEIEPNTINEEISEIEEELEIEKEVEQSEEISEPKLSDLKEETSELYEELDEEKDEVEQHQVEAAIEEELETEAETIVNEKEIEKLQEMDVEEQFQTVHLNEYVDELVEKQNEEIEQLKEQVEKDELEAQASKIKEANSELYEVVEVERDELDQHEVEATIEEELETIPEPIINEKEVEKLQELDIEEQFQTVRLNEYIDELVEKQEEDKNNENDKIEQEQENIEQTQEVKHQSTYLQEKLEEQEQELELDYEEKDEVEQHQVEAAIEEELKTEPKPIINEEELEYIKVLEPKKQLEAELFYEFIEELANKQNEEKEEGEENEEQEEISTEQKVAQIMRELDIPQEINTGETEVETNSQEGELEQETTSPDVEVVEQLKIEENKDHQQELEEILEQVRKIEQEALNEIEQEEEDLDKTIEKNYERVKKLYKQQTGKRPIYANKETKGFKQWLEQKKKSKEKEIPKQKKELKEEQKKEETWKWFLKNWIGRATEIDPELKSELKKLVEEYDELEKWIKKYSQLYNKAHRENLSQAEKNELKSLIKALQKIDPIKIELFLGIREIKRYLDDQHFFDFWDKSRLNRIRRHFFTQLSQIYKSLKQDQKKKENLEEILRNWIEQASEEEISHRMKALLKEIVENYSELEELATKFMELFKKEQLEQISQSEKVKLKSLIKTLEKLDPINIVLFANIRAIKHYLNDQHLDDLSNKARVNRVISKFFKHISQKYKELRKEQKNEKIIYLNNCLVNQGNLGENSLNPLNSKQIKKYEQIYHRKLERLCVKYALDFKNIIIDEYGYKLLNLEKQIPLSSHFGFRLDGYIRKVTNQKRDRAIGVDILERVRLHIVQKYSTITKDAAKETSFRKVVDFIKEYKEFSLHVSGKSGQGMFSISNIKYEQSSGEIAPKSWLFENMRYMFPKKSGLPISDNLLSWFIFGDSPSYGRVSKLKWTTEGKELSKRMYLSELLAIDYSVNKLTKKAFSNKCIKISNKKLETLKKSVSFLIYYYVFGGYHESTYVSKTTTKELEVGKNFFTIEYEVIRAIFFAAAEANNGEPLNFEELQIASGTSDLKNHLYEGFGFGDDFNRLLEYFNKIFKNRPLDSSTLIFRDAKEVLEGYRDAYRAKDRAFQKTRKHASKFQGRVHKELEDFLGLKFTKEVQVRAVVKEKYVSTINDDGVKEKIYVHGTFKFDGYLDLSGALKDYLGLDDKWMGIAFEALGTYWHGDANPSQQEADRKKRLICKEKNIILIEIWEHWSSNTWGNEILEQIKEKTGVEIPRSLLGNLAKYLGNK